MVVFRRKEISFGNISDSVLFPASNVNFSGGLKLTIKNKGTDVSSEGRASQYPANYYIDTRIL